MEGQVSKRSSPSKKVRPPKLAGKLPTGEDALLDSAYDEAWQQFNNALQQALVAEVVGFDPKVLLRDCETGVVYTLPLPVARKIVALWDQNEHPLT